MIIDDFYKALLERLNFNNTGLKHIDLFNDQVNQEENELPYPRPAAFIAFDDIVWSTLGNKKRMGDCRFQVHIVYDTGPQDTSSRQKSAALRNNGLNHLQIMEKVNYWLQGFNGEFFGSIAPDSMSIDQNRSTIAEHILPFKCMLYDSSAKRELKKIAATATDPQQVITGDMSDNP